jgi:hypothetical protein
MGRKGKKGAPLPTHQREHIQQAQMQYDATMQSRAAAQDTWVQGALNDGGSSDDNPGIGHLSRCGSLDSAAQDYLDNCDGGDAVAAHLAFATAPRQQHVHELWGSEDDAAAGPGPASMQQANEGVTVDLVGDPALSKCTLS